jgi:predicted nucleic acid-binding Zn ribbon protein
VQRQLRGVLTSVARSSSVILCTCSTLGAAAETFDGAFGARVLRIDRPLARAVVAQGSRIAVVAALASTLEPTRALLEDEAARAGKRVRVKLSVCEGAWDHFERGDEAAYLRAVARHAEGVAEQAEVIVLAQASMAGAGAFIRSDKPVLSSPRLGLRAALELLAAPTGTTPANL